METIKKGSNGEAVRLLQKILNKHGYMLADDGVFGKLTEAAVREYQDSQGLAIDGIVGRQTWARLLGDDALNLKKSKRKITEIILHCTATREGQPTTVEAIRRYHVKNRGWSDIGYHYVVYLDGSIHEGRNVDISGAHCTGHNAHSIGVCYVGGLDKHGKAKDTRTPEQKATLIKLVKQLMQTYRLSANQVYGHYQFANKACPSFRIEPFRKSLL